MPMRKRKPKAQGQVDNDTLMISPIVEDEIKPRHSSRAVAQFRLFALVAIGLSLLWYCYYCCWQHWPIDDDEDYLYQKARPHQIRYNSETNQGHPVKPKYYHLHLEPSLLSSPKVIHHSSRNSHAHSSSEEDGDDTSCQPMKEWQHQIFPSCNTAHEVNMRPETGSVEFLGCGSDRCAFTITSGEEKEDDDDDADDSENVVLKISRYKKDIDEKAFHVARKDGVSMERLQFSDFIVDIYGACGLSQIIELADSGGHMPDLIITLHGVDPHAERKSFILEKLKIVYHIAGAVADIHGFEKDNQGEASLVHDDIDVYQFLLVNGRYKLNDFHLSRFQTKNKKTGETCPLVPGYVPWPRNMLIRSPEEAIDWGSPQLLEKTDVYTMGNVMYYVLTGRWLFQGIDVEEALRRLRNGMRSPWPNAIAENDDRAILAMKKGIEMWWIHDPDQRPKATKIRDFLRKELKHILRIEEGRELSIEDVRIHHLQDYVNEYEGDDDGGYTDMFEGRSNPKSAKRSAKQILKNCNYGSIIDGRLPDDGPCGAFRFFY